VIASISLLPIQAFSKLHNTFLSFWIFLPFFFVLLLMQTEKLETCRWFESRAKWLSRIIRGNLDSLIGLRQRPPYRPFVIHNYPS